MKVKLKEVRLSFPALFEAKEFKAGDNKFRYDATFLIVPGSENDKMIRAAIAAEAAEKYGKKAAANLKMWETNPNKYCYRDGNTQDYEGYADMMSLAAHRKALDGPPTILDRDRKKLTPMSGKPYAGCYVNATVEIYAQTGENAGIRCSFSGVQFVKDGDAFSGGAPASLDEFDDLGVEDGLEDGLDDGDIAA